MSTVDFDWDLFLDGELPEHNSVRIGFCQRSLVYTNQTYIAVFQDNKSMNYSFCCYNGKCDFDFRRDTYFPIAIIMSENTDMAEMIIPLRCIPVYENDKELKKEGVEMVFSYYGDLKPSLYKEGKKQNLTENENYLLVWYYLYIKYKEIGDQAYWKQASLTKENIEKRLQSIEKSLESFSIEDVLKGLRINVKEIFINKVGGDDRYYVHKKVETNYPIEQMDSYIQDYIGIGDREIYRDSGYTSNLAIKGLIKGEYNEEQLKNEKEKLISNYSKSKHAESLLIEYIADRAHPAYHQIPNIAKKIKMLERASNFWVYWRIVKSKKFSSFFDSFDKQHSRSGIKEGDLKEANNMLRDLTLSVHNLEKTEIYTELPIGDIF